MPTPTIGQTYVSPTDPDIAIYIESVSAPEPDGFFIVEICHPADINDMSAIGHELTNDEWDELCATHSLTPSACK